jgi:glyoxylate/hydroxypyruvate reductase
MGIALFLSRSDPLLDAWVRSLSTALPSEALVLAEDLHHDPTRRAEMDIALVRGADPFLTFSTPIRTAFPSLRLVHGLWAGVEKLVKPGVVDDDLPIVRTIDPSMADSMAASVLAHVLDIVCGHDRYRAQQVRAEWREHPAPVIGDTTIGILGLGALGRRCGEALVSIGFKVVGVRSSMKPDSDERITMLPTFDAVANVADVIVNLLPLTEATRGVFKRSFFGSMKSGASLVNVARGAHVVDEDLIAALDTGHLRRAVLDVFDEEPLPREHPFWEHPQVTITPHVAADTNPRTAAQIIARNITAFRSGALQSVDGLVDRTRGY